MMQISHLTKVKGGLPEAETFAVVIKSPGKGRVGLKLCGLKLCGTETGWSEAGRKIAALGGKFRPTCSAIQCYANRVRPAKFGPDSKERPPVVRRNERGKQPPRRTSPIAGDLHRLRAAVTFGDRSRRRALSGRMLVFCHMSLLPQAARRGRATRYLMH